MRFVIHSPFVSASAIGAAAQLVGAELAELDHEVIYVDSSIKAGVSDLEEAIPWGDVARVTAAHAGAAAIIYHIGNHYPYHRGGLEWLAKAPGIVVVHDYFLGHLFYGWANDANPALVDRTLTEYAGISRTRFEEMARSASFIDLAVVEAPMVEWVVAQAVGVVVHSSWDVSRIVPWAMGPVRRISLAYDPKFNLDRSRVPTPGRLSVLTFGHINSNKLAHEVIAAIGADLRLAAAVDFRIAGPVEQEYQFEMQRRASELGVSVKFVGRVDDQVLAQEIADADVVACLRLPALESASASAIESLKSGKPTLVVDTGFYAELPDDIVVKISPASVRSDLTGALNSLLDSAALRASLGERGRAYADSEFSARYYALQLVEFAEEVGAARIVTATVEKLAKDMSRWGFRGDPQIAAAVVEPLAILDLP